MSVLLQRLRNRRRVCATWLARLGSELERSPLAQLSFFIGVAGVIFGLVSAWHSVITLLRQSWWLLVLAALVGLLTTKVVRGYSRRRSTGLENEDLVEAYRLVRKLLETHRKGVLRRDVVDFLEQRLGSDAEQLLDKLIASGYVTYGYDDRLRIGGRDSE